MEDKKSNIFFLILSGLSLGLTVYVFYNTVLNQIISQNQGYFYALIFGLILLISFVICNLFTKLVAISDNNYDLLTVRMSVIGILVVMGALFLLLRMRYSTSVSPNEYSCYKIALSLNNDTFMQSQDLINDAMYNPGHFMYSLLLALLMKIFGEGIKPVLWVNAVFIIACGILSYFIVAKLTDRVCGIFSCALMLFMPSQTFSVYSFSAQPLVTAICLACILIYSLIFCLDKDMPVEEEDEDEGLINSVAVSKNALILTLLGAVFSGLMILVEPLMVIPVVLLVISCFALKKKGAFNVLLCFVGGAIVFALLCFAKTGLTGLDIGEAIGGEFAAFEPCVNQISGNEEDFSAVFDKFITDISSSEETISDNFFFITKSSGENVYSDTTGSWIIILNQILYMFSLLMTLSCVVLSVKEKQADSSIVYSAIIGSVAALLFSQNREGRGFLFVQLLVIASSIGIHYLYLDHHPEEAVLLNPLDALEKTGRKEIAAATRSNLQAARDMEDEEFTKRAEALIFVDIDDDLYNEIKKEEHRKLMAKDGHANVLDDTFDDYDDDFFLDSEDDESEAVTVISVAPSGTSEAKKGQDAYEVNANMHAAAKLNKAKIPAWKIKNNSIDNEDFDDFDDADKKSKKAVVPEEEPVVTKIDRSSRGKRKAEKEESIKMSSSPATTKLNNGVPVRRVKTINAGNKVSSNKTSITSEENERFIPNPLPLPPKREHKEMDYDINDSSDEDWDV